MGGDSGRLSHQKESPSWDRALGSSAVYGLELCRPRRAVAGLDGLSGVGWPVGVRTMASCSLGIGVQFACVFHSGHLMVLGGMSPSQKVLVS